MLAVLLAALASDFLFLEPLLTFTRNSVLLTGAYSAGTAAALAITRKR